MSRSEIVTQTVASLAEEHGDVQALPVSFAQRRFWILDQLDGESAAYTIPQALRIKGALKADALAKAFNAVVARHEALRTVFVLEGDEPVQVVLPHVAVALPCTDLRSLNAADAEARVQTLAAESANQSFDLASGPLLRTSLLQLTDAEFVLLVSAHHLVADGWSMGLLFSEVEIAYSAFTTGASPAFTPLALQYPDFAVWQRKVMNGNAATKQLAFWRERLAGLEPLEMPIDFPRPAALSVRGGKRELELSPAVVDGIRALARRESATPSMAFLAAFFALLHRYSGQENFAVATITSGRLRAEVEPLIGLFVNTLAVRSNVQDSEPFTSLLRSVVQSSTDAQANQNVPFEHVVDALKLPYDQSRPALVQVCCQLLEGLGREPRLPGLEVSRVPSVKQSSKFELTLMLHPMSNGGLRAVLEYASDLFEASTIDRMLAHYANMLAGIVRDPGAAVGKLPMLSTSERTEVLERWNDTTQPLPTWRVPDRILAQAQLTPAAVAVRAGNRSLTYGELAQQSAVLATALKQNGVVAGSRVAVCVDRTPDLLVALLAVLRVGGAYVPIDASYPSDRISYVLGDAGVVAIVADSASMASLPWTNLPIVRVDELGADSGHTWSDATIDPESLAYVLYTSGSTGLPKGVMVPHRALANFLHSMAERPGLAAGDAVVAVTTLAFDIAGLELWLPLTVGGRIELASRETAIDGAQLSALVAKVSAEVGSGKCLMQATPATWRLLVESGWTGTTNLTMLCGGEGWPPGLAEQLLLRGAALWNVYGPTETTIWSSREHVTQAGPPSLGEPLANTTLIVFERGGEPAPLGVPGELCIGGAGLAHGYHNRGELTAQRFIDRAPFGRLYRTGDLVVRRGNGRLEYLSRLDDQVKLRGHRIELGEIESVLAAQPEVSQTIVAVRAVGSPPELQLVAYLVLAENADETAAGIGGLLTARLRAALPSYMVPAIFVTLDAIPLTPNGKADRRALPTPDLSASIATEYVAPRTATEELVAAAWREVLGRAQVGVMDDFFASGGHSLAAMRISARLAELSSANVPIRVIFEARTPEGLATWMDANGMTLDDELTAMMAELDEMSDEEARALLDLDQSNVT